LFFDVVDGNSPVGVLWLGINPQTESWWIYDIAMHPQFRGLGHGRETLRLAEAEVRSRGGHELGLNVFGSNAVALHLYESVGYEAQNVRMKKTL
jgi:ribosomal protein S18 acetylase RimI-like enzyme